VLGPFATASRLTPIHQMLLAVLSHAACALVSTTSTTTTTTMRDRGDRYGPMEWAQLWSVIVQNNAGSGFNAWWNESFLVQWEDVVSLHGLQHVQWIHRRCQHLRLQGMGFTFKAVMSENFLNVELAKYYRLCQKYRCVR